MDSLLNNKHIKYIHKDRLIWRDLLEIVSAQLQAQVYYDRTYRRVQRQYKATTDTFDVDMQQQLQAASRHLVVFGAGFRVSRGDDLGDGPGFFFDPQVRTSTIGNVFVQDEIALPDQPS